jgi:hypothetical protein
MTTLQQELRALVAANGFEMVHTTLHEMMRQDYEFLSKIFKTVVPATVPAPTPAPVPAPAPAPAPTTVHTSLEVVQAMNPPPKKMVKITVRKAAEEPISSPPAAPMPPTPSPPHADEVQVNTIEIPTEKSKFRSPAEVKRYQKEAEAKKRTELDAKGITVASLMTRDNLKKWIEDEGHTFAWVAREMIGCSDTLVSSMARNYGIQSNISKKRGIIMGRA